MNTRAQEADHAAEPAADPWPFPPLDDLEQERARLEGEIAAAKARAVAAKLRTEARDTEVRSALRADLLSSKESLVEIERRYEVTIAMVREAAQSEVEQILAAAHRSAARQSAASDSEHETGDQC